MSTALNFGKKSLPLLIFYSLTSAFFQPEILSELPFSGLRALQSHNYLEIFTGYTGGSFVQMTERSFGKKVLEKKKNSHTFK